MPTDRDSEPEHLVDLRPSCTRDEAVAKLIGWRRGPLLRKYFLVTEDGVSADQLPDLLSTEMPLHEQLAAVREAALRRLESALQAEAPENELDERLASVDAIDALIRKAYTFMIELEDEISKGESSRLRVDHEATRETGKGHFTLASIDAWARDKYGGLSILDDATAVESRQPATWGLSDGSPEKAVRQRKLDNVLTTLAFALEALAEKVGKRYQHETGALNVKALANDLSARAAKANKDQFLKDQSAEAIKDRIEAALKTKRSQLPLT